MEVRLFASLRENRGKTVPVRWHEGMDGYALLTALGIPFTEVAIFLINGRHCKPEAMLNTDDIIALFPPVGGG
jgi:molybdopterin converting factor small subunit